MLHRFTFQFFAADDGGTGSIAAPAQPNMSSNPAQAGAAGQQGTSGVPAGGQTAPVAQVQQEESFEDLIKGRYKADYERSVKAAVSERLKGTKRTISRFSPILDVLGQQYGIDVSDPEKVDYDALTRMLTDDKRLYEQEALEKGIPLETLMHMKQVERQNAALQRENAMAQGEMQRRAEFDRIVGEFAEVQALYPGADLAEGSCQTAFRRARRMKSCTSRRSMPRGRAWSHRRRSSRRWPGFRQTACAHRRARQTQAPESLYSSILGSSRGSSARKFAQG